MNCDRFRILEASRSLKQLTFDDVVDKMDAVANDGTFQTMIFEASALKLHLAFGEGPASQFALKPIDLSSLFQRGDFSTADGTESHGSALVSPEVIRLDSGAYSVTFCYRPVNVHPVKSVHVAGTFNDWNPAALQMDSAGHQGIYRTVLQLGSGQYEYKFVINGERWRRDLSNKTVVGSNRNSVFKLGE